MATEHNAPSLHTHPLGFGLLDLPNELLIEILINVPSDFAKTLWAISLVCKHLQSIVESFMEPKYNLRGTVMGDPFVFTKRVAEKPLLQSVIRSMTIAPSFDKQLERSPEEVGQLVRSLDLEEFYETIPYKLGYRYNSPAFGLALLPRLESLDIKSDPTIGHYHPSHDSTTAHEYLLFFGDLSFNPTALKTHAFRNLVNLSLLFQGKDGVIVSHGRMFQLPNLRKVRISNVDFWHSNSYVPLGSSPVTELHLLDLVLFRNNMPEIHVFKLFRGLEKLYLNFRYWRDFRQFVPNKFFPILCTQKHSLQSLEVYSKVHRSIYSSTFSTAFSTIKLAPSPMSLSPIPEWSPVPSLKAFKRLKYLSLTDEALGRAPLSSPAFRYSSVADILTYLSEILPKSLESFTHIVWEGSGGGCAPLSDNEPNWRSWDRVWAASTREQFPKLKKVEVMSYGLNGVNDDRKLIWEMN